MCAWNFIQRLAKMSMGMDNMAHIHMSVCACAWNKNVIISLFACSCEQYRICFFTFYGKTALFIFLIHSFGEWTSFFSCAHGFHCCFIIWILYVVLLLLCIWFVIVLTFPYLLVSHTISHCSVSLAYKFINDFILHGSFAFFSPRLFSHSHCSLSLFIVFVRCVCVMCTYISTLVPLLTIHLSFAPVYLVFTLYFMLPLCWRKTYTCQYGCFTHIQKKLLYDYAFGFVSFSWRFWKLQSKFFNAGLTNKSVLEEIHAYCIVVSHLMNSTLCKIVKLIVIGSLLRVQIKAKREKK